MRNPFPNEAFTSLALIDKNYARLMLIDFIEKNGYTVSINPKSTTILVNFPARPFTQTPQLKISFQGDNIWVERIYDPYGEYIPSSLIKIWSDIFKFRKALEDHFALSFIKSLEN